MPELYIGLMSGTSLDGVDGVLVDFAGSRPEVKHHATEGFPQGLRSELLALNTAGDNELHRAALAANALAGIYAGVVGRLLASGGVANGHIAAIGAHGQTVRHRPHEFDGHGYTLQLNNPALLADLTGINVVADFRSRDVAAGGQGAPLVPAFHKGFFWKPGQAVAVLNLGGIANLSVLEADGSVTGFDCGPGNALMDYWCQRHTGQPFDAGGAWASSGQVIDALLKVFLAEPYLSLTPPKSTGRDLFNPAWLARQLAPFAAASAKDVQATLAEFTAQACAAGLTTHGRHCRILIVCGGGVLNDNLMLRLRAALPAITVESSQSHGLPPLQVEATAFAWLARELMLGRQAGMPLVTGARGPRILGALYPR
jgi:anhydro-N-acetylmuramic acid kinase